MKPGLREQCYGALWARLEALPEFRLHARRVQIFDDVPPEMQPSIMQTQTGEHISQVKGIPPTSVLEANIYVYHHCGGSDDALPAPSLNELTDVVEQALAPNVMGYQTLGGLVSHCWIEGQIQTFEGFKGMMDQSIIIIPVRIKVPDASGPV